MMLSSDARSNSKINGKIKWETPGGESQYYTHNLPSPDMLLKYHFLCFQILENILHEIKCRQRWQSTFLSSEPLLFIVPCSSRYHFYSFFHSFLLSDDEFLSVMNYTPFLVVKIRPLFSMVNQSLILWNIFILASFLPPLGWRSITLGLRLNGKKLIRVTDT